MTQATLAETVDLSPNYYSAIERGIKIPQLDTMVRIVNALGASLDDVLADQLSNGLGVTMRASLLSSELEGLSLSDREYILTALEAMIYAAKYKSAHSRPSRTS